MLEKHSRILICRVTDYKFQILERKEFGEFQYLMKNLFSNIFDRYSNNWRFIFNNGSVMIK